ncbi:TonB-dependent receptor [Dysgonomonas sp. 520]|uniref:SusC/RagA family TonB-linked outer membrane protein n=1 Tax=Dysgonomonas sp. 520 TaxID=2302931 RepID=UPI002103B72E|nr:TonB-dependent receptor [Dysgonomonas sp. 520]
MITLLLLSAGFIKAQTRIEGKVVDQEGIEIIGATIIVKGKSSVGTVTDMDGRYTITINDPSKDILVFSYIGMESQDVKVNNRTTIDVTLSPNSVILDEVVAIGYGTMKRNDISGSVSSVKGKEIGKIPVTNVGQALAGKVAGVQVTQSQGSPDAAIEIRVRGGMSITQNNDPLFVIDGFISESGLLGIDPSDIASIDVLKDASATAIYGSAGANGVILISTKTAKEGKAVITYDGYVGFKKLTKRMDVMNVEDFVNLEYERAMIGDESEKNGFLNRYGDGRDAVTYPNVLDNMYLAHGQIHEVYANRPGINWQDEVFDGNTPISQSHKIGISGGNKTSTYNVSYAYMDEDGIMPGSGLTRNSLRGKFSYQLNPKMRFSANVSYTDEVTRGMGSLNDAGQFSRMQHIIQYRPMYMKHSDDSYLLNMQNDPVQEDENGNQMQNPLISIENEKRERRNKLMSLNGELTYAILKNLRYRGTIGLRTRTTDNDMFYASGSRQAINSGGPWGRRDEYEYYTLQYNNTLTWNTKINKLHKIDVLVGQETAINDPRTRTHTYTQFPGDNFGLEDLGLATQIGIPSNSRTDYRKYSFFTRANYNYNEKYLATFTFRTDGSTKFGKNNRWGYFPAISLAWRAVEEDFINKLNIFSDLKLRASYGTSGNDAISSYLSLATMHSSLLPFNNAMVNGYAQKKLANPDLKWETNTTANIGLDFGFLDQRIQASLDIYQNNATDLLLQRKVPFSTSGGIGSYMANIGETQNRGIEFAINTVNITTSDFSWTTSLNLAHNRNKVKKLADASYFTTRSGWVQTSEFNADDYITRVGKSVGLMYGYKSAGIYTVDDFDYVEYSPGKFGYQLKDGIAYDPGQYNVNNMEKNSLQPGSWKFVDVDQSDGEKGIINAKDKTVIGDATPDLFGGFINNFTYKSFDLSIGFTYRIGGDVYNANKMYYTKMSNRGRNSLKQSLDRFTYIDENGRNVFGNPAELARINQDKQFASIRGSANMVFHSGYVEDGSFLRLDNITFGYSIPKKLLRKFYVSNLRVYASTYNLWTLSNYSGFDPEVNVKPNSGLTPNVDWGAYPRSFTMVFGINLTL